MMKFELVSEQSCEQSSPLAVYRDRTTAMLRRYFRLALETGRLPSLLGREFFRTRVSSYHVQTFEDAVIFVHDIERCLEKLDETARQLIARLALQEYSEEETAKLLGCSDRHVRRCYPEALDRLSDIFLRVGLLEPLPSTNSASHDSGKPVAARPAYRAGADDVSRTQGEAKVKTIIRLEACQEPKFVIFRATA